jgi:hypothetical protein
MAHSAFRTLIPMLGLALAALPARADFTLTNTSSRVVYVRGKEVIVMNGSLRLQVDPRTASSQPQVAWSPSGPRQFSSFEGTYDSGQVLKTLVCALPPGGVLTVSSRGPAQGLVQLQKILLVLCPETLEGAPGEVEDGCAISHVVLAGQAGTLADDSAAVLLTPPTPLQLDIHPNGRDLTLKDHKGSRSCVIL